jgi:hypothetical protein
MSSLVYAEHTGTEISIPAKSGYKTISDLQVKVPAACGRQVLVSFTAPDTWNNTQNGGTSFRIVSLDGSGKVLSTVGSGYIVFAAANQRIPFALSAVVEGQTAEQTLAVQWQPKTSSSVDGTSYIGKQGLTTLSALVM